jgi:Nucleotidyl transferase AbiEii toxin, Type IV TA system
MADPPVGPPDDLNAAAAADDAGDGIGTPTAGQTRPLASLPERGKEPTSARILTGWINQAQVRAGLSADRLSWLVASTVVVAALQRAVDNTGTPLFLLKGGTYLQHRLHRQGRATKDVDGIIRGDLDEFLARLDEVLAAGWGPLAFRRSAPEVIASPARVVKPRRFDVQVLLQGIVWRRVQVEISPDEGGAAQMHEVLVSPALAHFGLKSPVELLGISVRYQIAQKLHAGSDPHQPPDLINERARDVPDLLLLRDLIDSEGHPSLDQVREACVDLFDARRADSLELGREPRTWPCRFVAHPHWRRDYEHAARQAGIELDLDAALARVNEWIAEIDRAVTTSHR